MSMLIKALLFVSTICIVSINSLKSQTFNKNELTLSSTFGENQAVFSIAYVYNWQIGKKKKLELGLGVRLTNFNGSKINYTTAPAKLSRTNTIPFLTVLSGQSYENWDSLEVQRPLIFALNTTANIKYHFSNKVSAGFNIDLFGVSIGRNSSAILTTSGLTRTEHSSNPTLANYLLTGDLDHGTLNSETFLSYQIKSNLSIRLVYQFLFTEYSTKNIYQIAPDGTEVYRFRNKANNIGLGISYTF